MADRQVLGQHLVWLALYQIVHPEGTIAEACVFLLNMDPQLLCLARLWLWYPAHCVGIGL